MKVLITGSGGQLGRALQQTAPANTAIVAIDVQDVDLTKADDLRAKIASIAPEILINAAAYTAVDKAEIEEDLAR